MFNPLKMSTAPHLYSLLLDSWLCEKNNRALQSHTTHPYFPTWAWQDGSRREGWWEEGPFCHQWGVTREHTINIHKCIHGMGFKKCAPREIRKFAMKAMGTLDAHINTKLNEAVWAKGIRAVPSRIHMPLSKKCKEDEDSPNKFYTLVTCVPFTTFKKSANSPSEWELNCWLSNEVIKLQKKKKLLI